MANLSKVMMLFFPFLTPHDEGKASLNHPSEVPDSILKGPQMFVGESMSQVFVFGGECRGMKISIVPWE